MRRVTANARGQLMTSNWGVFEGGRMPLWWCGVLLVSLSACGVSNPEVGVSSAEQGSTTSAVSQNSGEIEQDTQGDQRGIEESSGASELDIQFETAQEPEKIAGINLAVVTYDNIRAKCDATLDGQNFSTSCQVFAFVEGQLQLPSRLSEGVSIEWNVPGEDEGFRCEQPEENAFQLNCEIDVAAEATIRLDVTLGEQDGAEGDQKSLTAFDPQDLLEKADAAFGS